MAGWIFRIRAGNPEHLEIAVDRGYWDFEPELDVRAGDDIYFWQGGKRSHLRAMARALSSPRVLQEGDEHPWNDDVQYLWRVSLELLKPAPSEDVNWGRLKSTVVDRGLFTQDPVYKLSDEDSARVAELFTASEENLQWELPLEVGVAEAGHTSGSGGAGYLADAERRSLIEMFAQQRVADHYEGAGWRVEDTHVGHPYDLVATKGPLTLFIEAKGTQQDGLEVEVTDGEVQFARRNPGVCQWASSAGSGSSTKSGGLSFGESHDPRLGS